MLFRSARRIEREARRGFARCGFFHQQIVGPKMHQAASDVTVIDTALKEAAPDEFTHLEALAPKAHLVADTLSIADLAVVSNLIMFHYLGHRI